MVEVAARAPEEPLSLALLHSLLPHAAALLFALLALTLVCADGGMKRAADVGGGGGGGDDNADEGEGGGGGDDNGGLDGASTTAMPHVLVDDSVDAPLDTPLRSPDNALRACAHSPSTPLAAKPSTPSAGAGGGAGAAAAAFASAAAGGFS